MAMRRQHGSILSLGDSKAMLWLIMFPGRHAMLQDGSINFP
jgi:hypothetical protein